MANPGPLLSKSKYLAGLQWPRLLWTHYNEKNLIPKPEVFTQARFDQGHEVGEVAKSLYPDGVEIGSSGSTDQVIARSAKALKARKPLFEAGFKFEGAYARVDVLKPTSGDKWDLIEVKSTTTVKDVHLPDVAFQKYVYEGAGVPIGRCFLMYLDKRYIRHGNINAADLLGLTDITDDLEPFLSNIPADVRQMQSIIARTDCPADKPGSHCNIPYHCPLYDDCWSFLPDRNIYSLYRGGNKIEKLRELGILKIKDIPRDFPLSVNQTIQVECERSGEPFIDKNEIWAFLNGLRYPLYFLDFETFMTAIPKYDLLRPYESVPFQYSLHILESPNGHVKHQSFLADGHTDPRPEILSRLRNQIGNTGSIIAYNAGYEIRQLASCVSYFPEYAGWLESIRPRFINLLVPFRSFYYYHPDQQGSASLKAVMPILTSKSYEQLDISDGETASLKFLELMSGNLTESEQGEIRRALKKYCHKDTEGMIEIVRELEKLSH